MYKKNIIKCVQNSKVLPYKTKTKPSLEKKTVAKLERAI